MNDKTKPVNHLGSAKQKMLSSIASLPELAAVEELIRSRLSSDAEDLSNISHYLFSLGGKRIRPILTLLCSKVFSQEVPPEVLKISAGIELIHMATLLHDDIIDKSPLRRHHESPLSKFGVTGTLLAGDFLLTRAFGLCGSLDQFIIDETEKTCVALTEGEIMETPLYVEEHSIASSLEIARKKTASLFRLATLAPTHLHGCDHKVQNTMAIFGEKLGLSFQIMDDILDVTSSSASLGKQPGSDLRERKPSIINTLWLESGNPLSKKLLVSPEAEQDHFISVALTAINEGDTIDKAKKLASQYVRDAKQALDTTMEQSKSYNIDIISDLKIIADYAIERIS